MLIFSFSLSPSPQSAYVTGTEFVIDGGISM